MAETHSTVAHQFDDVAQQHEANVLGMWVFLATEVLFFGGLFVAFTIYRASYHEAFTQASRHLDVLLGGINSALLFTSSFTMTMALRSAQQNQRKALIAFLILTIVLGATFLGIKGTEYYHKFEQHLVPGQSFHYEAGMVRQAQLFFSFYFVMTGMHALHLVIGIAILAVPDRKSTRL